MDEFLAEGAPRKKGTKYGVYTGARRVPYPKVFRPYGNNTRERVVGRRPTGMHTMGYDKNLVGSHPVPPLLPSTAIIGQRGAPTVTTAVAALKPGRGHWLFEG